MEKNDKQLIIDYLKGDEQAFSTLVNRYLKSIYNFIYRLIGSLEEAEDLTQKTFFQAWKNQKYPRRLLYLNRGRLADKRFYFFALEILKYWNL